LGYHGCDTDIAEKLLNNELFLRSENTYDWLGSGIYFWEANPDRALAWAVESAERKALRGIKVESAVVGAVIDLGFCLDLVSANGVAAVEKAYEGLCVAMKTMSKDLPVNSGGEDLRMRYLDCEVMNYLHAWRKRDDTLVEFDTVRGVFTEGEPVYPNAGFRRNHTAKRWRYVSATPNPD
jgi:hypothetical protein